ncbi:hypothetical protein B0H17DRAFT_1285194 [Mycena rosella]|uniref:Uncharacterized protein n=1 Tax=Mycena rosella TaxID=1033263 RepID=A0AAD7FNP5_MYCRO|nr:hypothetical protein B0H17DRAFT_1285194 [Mycena rosella]
MSRSRRRHGTCASHPPVKRPRLGALGARVWLFHVCPLVEQLAYGSRAYKDYARSAGRHVRGLRLRGGGGGGGKAHTRKMTRNANAHRRSSSISADLFAYRAHPSALDAYVWPLHARVSGRAASAHACRLAGPTAARSSAAAYPGWGSWVSPPRTRMMIQTLVSGRKPHAIVPDVHGNSGARGGAGGRKMAHSIASHSADSSSLLARTGWDAWTAAAARLRCGQEYVRCAARAQRPPGRRAHSPVHGGWAMSAGKRERSACDGAGAALCSAKEAGGRSGVGWERVRSVPANEHCCSSSVDLSPPLQPRPESDSRGRRGRRRPGARAARRARMPILPSRARSTPMERPSGKAVLRFWVHREDEEDSGRQKDECRCGAAGDDATLRKGAESDGLLPANTQVHPKRDESRKSKEREPRMMAASKRSRPVRPGVIRARFSFEELRTHPPSALQRWWRTALHTPHTRCATSTCSSADPPAAAVLICRMCTVPKLSRFLRVIVLIARICPPLPINNTLRALLRAHLLPSVLSSASIRIHAALPHEGESYAVEMRSHRTRFEPPRQAFFSSVMLPPISQRLSSLARAPGFESVCPAVRRTKPMALLTPCAPYRLPNVSTFFTPTRPENARARVSLRSVKCKTSLNGSSHNASGLLLPVPSESFRTRCKECTTFFSKALIWATVINSVGTIQSFDTNKRNARGLSESNPQTVIRGNLGDCLTSYGVSLSTQDPAPTFSQFPITARPHAGYCSIATHPNRTISAALPSFMLPPILHEDEALVGRLGRASAPIGECT